jgi:hypothetical protein
MNIYEGITFDRVEYWSEQHKSYVAVYRALRGGKVVVLATTQTAGDQGYRRYLVTGEPQIAPGYSEGKPDVQTSPDQPRCGNEPT